MALKIQQTCEPAFEVDGQSVRVSASIGIALFPEHGTTTAELLRRADAAMYLAKRSGSGHAVFDAEHETHSARQLALLTDLRQCIARDQLVVHYQPKIDLGTREISGVEALLRWQHPDRGLLLPASFMPEIERTELIEPVTRWLLNQALRQQHAWLQQGIDLTMAINISAASLSSGSSLPDIVAELTETWGTAPDRLTLELTEDALIDTAAPDLLERLHSMGEQLSIDDYGTGHSSLAHLRRLPVDELKIDKSFITHLAALQRRRGDRTLDRRPRPQPRPDRRRGRRREPDRHGPTRRIRMRQRPGVLLQPPMPSDAAHHMADRVALHNIDISRGLVPKPIPNTLCY